MKLRRIERVKEGWRGPFLDIDQDGTPHFFPDLELRVKEGRTVEISPNEAPDLTSDDPLEGEAELILPGFCNPHTHLELTRLRGRLQPTQSFPEWARQIYELKIELHGGGLASGVRRGLDLSIEEGVTAIADTVCAIESLEALARAPIPTVGYCEAIAVSDAQVDERYSALTQLSERALELERESGGRFLSGVSVHAPHTVCDAMMCAMHASHGRVERVSIHVAETRAEREFLVKGTGPFRDFFDRAGLLPHDWRPKGIGPVENLEVQDWLPRAEAEFQEAGYLERVRGEAPRQRARTILAHGNYLEPKEVELLKARRVAVCWCPETHAFFSHDPYPIERNRALPLLLGTDSLASAWSLSPLEQVRRALNHARNWSVADALAAVTLRARDAVFGRPEGAPRADFTVLRLRADRLRHLAGVGPGARANEILAGILRDPATRPSRTIVGGKEIWAAEAP